MTEPGGARAVPALLLWGDPWGACEQRFGARTQTQPARAGAEGSGQVSGGTNSLEQIFSAWSKGHSTGFLFPHLLLGWRSPAEGEKQLWGFAEEKALSAAEGPVGLSSADSGSVHRGAAATSCLKMQHPLPAPCHPLRRNFSGGFDQLA